MLMPIIISVKNSLLDLIVENSNYHSNILHQSVALNNYRHILLHMSVVIYDSQLNNLLYLTVEISNYTVIILLHLSILLINCRYI